MEANKTVDDNVKLAERAILAIYHVISSTLLARVAFGMAGFVTFTYPQAVVIGSFLSAIIRTHDIGLDLDDAAFAELFFYVVVGVGAAAFFV